MSNNSSKVQSISWVLYCTAVCGVAFAVESVPFMGSIGLWAGGGRAAIRVAFFVIPLMLSLFMWAVSVSCYRVSYRYTFWHWLLVLLGGMVLLSTLFSTNGTVAVFGSAATELGALAYLNLFVAIFLGSQLVNNKSRLNQLTWLVLATGVIVAFVALLEVAGLRVFAVMGEPWMYSRGMSTLMNPDFLGGYLLIPCIIGWTLVSATKGWRKIIAISCFLVVFSSFLLAQTRGAWIGFGVAFTVHAFWHSRSKSRIGVIRVSDVAKKMVFPIVLVGAVTVASLLGVKIASGLVDRVVQIFSDFDVLRNGFGGRIGIWQEVSGVVFDHPLIGVGADGLGHAWQQYAGLHTLNTTGSSVVVSSSHSLYIDLAVYFGIPFLVIFICLYFGAVFSSMYSARAGEERSTDGRILLGWASAVVGMGIALATAVTNMPLLVTACTALGVLLAHTVSSESVPSAPTRKMIAIVVIPASLLILAYGLVELGSARAGNIDSGNASLRLERAITAHTVAPWRKGPIEEMMNALPVVQSFNNINMSRADILELIEDQLGDDAIALYNLGDYYLRVVGDIERALSLSERALAIRPLFVPGIMLRADVLSAVGRNTEANVLYNKAINLESGVRTDWAWSAPWIGYMDFLKNNDMSIEYEVVVSRFIARFSDDPAVYLYKDGVHK